MNVIDLPPLLEYFCIFFPGFRVTQFGAWNCCTAESAAQVAHPAARHPAVILAACGEH